MSDKLPIVVGSEVVSRFNPSGAVGSVTEHKGSLDIRVRWPDGTEDRREATNLIPVRSFTWKRWNGNSDSISGVERVEFGTAHVVFYGMEEQIVRAVRIEQINELVETTRRR